jgi:hypothetical protein
MSQNLSSAPRFQAEELVGAERRRLPAQEFKAMRYGCLIQLKALLVKNAKIMRYR